MTALAVWLVLPRPPAASPDPTPIAEQVVALAALPARPRPQAMPRSRPVELRAPLLGRVRGILELGLREDGSLEVPANASDAGWYSRGVSPGERGPAVLVGHVNYDGRRGVFARLGALRPGAVIAVTRADGTTVDFRVRLVERVAKSAFPTERVYGPTQHPELRLITCGGSFDEDSGHYRDNVVVFADAVTPGATASGSDRVGGHRVGTE